MLLSEPLTPEDSVVITVDKNGHKIEVTNVTKRNPYTLQFKMPCKYTYTYEYICLKLTQNKTKMSPGQNIFFWGP